VSRRPWTLTGAILAGLGWGVFYLALIIVLVTAQDGIMDTRP